MLAFVYVKFEIDLAAKINAFDKLFFIVGPIYVTEEIPRAAVEHTQGYMLNVPTQQVSCYERGEKL